MKYFVTLLAFICAMGLIGCSKSPADEALQMAADYASTLSGYVDKYQAAKTREEIKKLDAEREQLEKDAEKSIGDNFKEKIKALSPEETKDFQTKLEALGDKVKKIEQDIREARREARKRTRGTD